MSKTKKICFVAIITGLAFIASKIKIVPLPFGGSITLFSMLILMLPAALYGVSYGIYSIIVFSILKIFFASYIVHPMQILCDYVFAYSGFIIVAFIKNNKKFELGIIYASIVRFIFTSLSGYIFFKEYAPEGMNALVYTIIYNGGYIFAETILTIVLLQIKTIKEFIYKLGDF